MISVAMMGAGYVGLVTGACLAELGHYVVCVDTDAAKIAGLEAGVLPIYEPGLQALVAATVKLGRLSFTTDIEAAVAGGVDVLFIAVGTPNDGNGGEPTLLLCRRRRKAPRVRSPQCRAGRDAFTAIVAKSTVPIGTNRKLAAIVGRHLPPSRFALASNPEFLREGNAIEDFMRGDRIVIGARSERARRLLEELYLPLTRRGVPLVATSTVETAELIKYAANAYLATRVAFINELARLCEATDADIKELALGVGLDSRIGTRFFAPGPGFGGSCFPKDLAALAKTGIECGSPVEIVETVIRANDRHKQLMVRKIRHALGGRLEGRRIGVLGLTFKANTDDMRDAPALTILPQLMAEGAQVSAYDPAAAQQAKALMPDLHLETAVEAVLAGADAAVVLTEWAAFRELPWAKLAASMRRPLVVDLRNLYEPEDMTRNGIEYVPLGRRQEVAPGFRAAAA